MLTGKHSPDVIPTGLSGPPMNSGAIASTTLPAPLFSPTVKGPSLIIHTLREHFACPPHFDVALDFGCGVGRLLFPLARRSRIAVGVDVSLSMLEECRKNAAEFGIRNIDLRPSDDTLSQVREFAGQVTFLNSLLVFQHIPPGRGLRIFGALLDLLSPSCCGVIQLVTGPPPPEHPPQERCNPPAPEEPPQPCSASAPDAPEPVMEMNPYDLNAVVSILHAKGIRHIFFRLDNHDGLVGVSMYFHRHRVDV